MAIEQFTITSNLTFTTPTAAALTAAAAERNSNKRGTDETDLEFLNRIVEELLKSYVVQHHTELQTKSAVNAAGDEARSGVTIRPKKDIPVTPVIESKSETRAEKSAKFRADEQEFRNNSVT